MEDRFLDAIALVEDRLTEEQKENVEVIKDLYEAVNTGYMDWNDWEEWYEDKSEDGLEAYVCSLFGLEYEPEEETENED